MKFLLQALSVIASVLSAMAETTIERVDVTILDATKGTCSVKINDGPPKSVDFDVESFVEGNDITVSLLRSLFQCFRLKLFAQIKFAAFSYIDGKFNEFIETDFVKLCDLPKSDHPLVSFMYKEMVKSGNLATACPIKKGSYYLHGFSIEESDLPMALPPGKFKIELNGTLHENDKDTPMFVSEIYFMESES